MWSGENRVLPATSKVAKESQLIDMNIWTSSNTQGRYAVICNMAVAIF